MSRKMQRKIKMSLHADRRPVFRDIDKKPKGRVPKGHAIYESRRVHYCMQISRANEDETTAK